jgi:hypothetical protein
MDLVRGLFSDRFRPLKLAASAAAVVLFAVGFLFWVEEERPSIAKIILNPSGWPGALVGPEHIQVESVGAEEMVLDAYGVPIRFSLPAGAEGERIRREAAALVPGEWISVVGRHGEGLRFETVRLVPDPYRKYKLLFSAAAALFVLGFLPVFYRWSGGALRPRRAEAVESTTCRCG